MLMDRMLMKKAQKDMFRFDFVAFTDGIAHIFYRCGCGF